MAVFMAAERFVITRLSRALPIAVWVRTVDADVATAHLRLVVLVNQWCGGCICDHVRLHFVQRPFKALLDVVFANVQILCVPGTVGWSGRSVT